MSNKLTLGIALLCGAFLVSCHKEPQGMLLVAEGFGGGKAAVEGNSSYWVDGETVRINNADYRVNVVDGNAYATGVAAADNYYALYPNTLAPEADLSTGSATVSIPSAYIYRQEGGRQALDLPMAAYGNSDSRLLFKHLTAAVTVWVVNHFGIDIEVDSIVVGSSDYQISGSRSVTIGSSLAIDTVATDNAADRRVVVRFNGGTTLKINCGDSAAVQVPVLPVGLKNRFTITVAVHNADDEEMKYTYSRTQASAGHALLRAQIGYAPARFGGRFSVGASKKVYFAPGNLQYYCSSSNPQWRFAQHQYDVAEYDGSYYSANSGHWIDLFGFGTSGNNGRVPYFATSSNSSYNPNRNISKTLDDWGWRNSITNGGKSNKIWYTLSAEEWTFLTSISDRPGKTGKGTINGTIKGLIILPDSFTLPTSCSSFVSNGSTGAEYTDNIYSTAQWKEMEIAGAIFLPSNGKRYELKHEDYISMGYYWSATWVSSTTASAFRIKDIGYDYPTTANYLGFSVRLVRDAN